MKLRFLLKTRRQCLDALQCALRWGWWTGVFWPVHLARAQTAAEPIKELSGIVSETGTLVINVIEVVVYLVAAWIGISSLPDAFRKGEWGKVILAAVLAFTMYVFANYFLGGAEKAMTDIK